MTSQAIHTLAFQLASGLLMVMLLPQCLTIAVRGRIAGVSVTGIAIGTVLNLLWLCYGVATADVAMTCVDAVTSLACLVTLTGLALRGAPVSSATWAAVVLGLTCCAGLAADHRAATLSTLGSCITVVVGLPQLWALRRAGDVSGVSLPTLGLSVLTCSAWAGYWLTTSTWIPFASQVWSVAVLLATSVVTLTRRRAGTGDSSVHAHALLTVPVPRPSAPGMTAAPEAA